MEVVCLVAPALSGMSTQVPVTLRCVYIDSRTHTVLTEKLTNAPVYTSVRLQLSPLIINILIIHIARFSQWQ